MCGICGIIDSKSYSSNRDERRLVASRMNESLLHRGPDATGILHQGRATLAMRRLAIIDLAGGDQPIWNEDRTVGVVMNGEIYNYRELKKELEESGHRFSTDADTEVLVHLYEEYGTEFLPRLRGMFAFCLYDLTEDRLLLARDRFGEKPLYYHQTEDRLIFSSEMASLLTAIPSRKIDHEALEYYLAVGYVPEPLTLVAGVESFPPGHLMTIGSAQADPPQPYFRISYPEAGRKLITKPEEAAELMEPLLKKAVKQQLVSDVPIGAFLSGGIDSSTVCALAQSQLSKPIQTFTVRFEDAAYDESAIAAQVARHIGSEHHEITVPNAEFSEDIFYEIIDHVGLPFPDSSAIPVYFISREIRQHLKVALSGDGGDEVFGGYDDFGWYQKIAPLTRFPDALNRRLSQLVSKLPLAQDRRRQIGRGLRAAGWGRSGLSFGIHRMQFEDEVTALLSDNKRRNYPLQTIPPPGFKNWSPLRQAMYYRLAHKLPTDMLIKVDRMSMANSLEVRAPLLDPDVFNASLQLADDLLYGGKGKGKVLLRHLMREQLPAAVFDHPKQGFSVPLHKYQNEVYRRLSDDLLGPGGPLDGLLRQSAINQISSAVFAGNFDRSKTTAYRVSHRHWMLLLLAGWVRRFNIDL